MKLYHANCATEQHVKFLGDIHINGCNWVFKILKHGNADLFSTVGRILKNLYCKRERSLSTKTSGKSKEKRAICHNLNHRIFPKSTYFKKLSIKLVRNRNIAKINSSVCVTVGI